MEKKSERQREAQGQRPCDIKMTMCKREREGKEEQEGERQARPRHGDFGKNITFIPRTVGSRSLEV